LAVGYFADLNDLRANWTADHTWNPAMEAGEREGMLPDVEEGRHKIVRLD
jgi:glycerol kinase